MADTIRTTAALQLLLANNTTGAISAQDIRDFLVSSFNRLDDVGIGLNASLLSSGTVADERLSSNVALKNINNSFSIAQTITGTCTATLFSGSGASLTSLPAANLTGTLPAISGANLTTLNGTNISSGTVADARLSSNIPKKDAANTFTNDNGFAGVTATTLVVSSTIATGDITASGAIVGETSIFTSQYRVSNQGITDDGISSWFPVYDSNGSLLGYCPIYSYM